MGGGDVEAFDVLFYGIHEDDKDLFFDKRKKLAFAELRLKSGKFKTVLKKIGLGDAVRKNSLMCRSIAGFRSSSRVDFFGQLVIAYFNVDFLVEYRKSTDTLIIYDLSILSGHTSYDFLAEFYDSTVTEEEWISFEREVERLKRLYKRSFEVIPDSLRGFASLLYGNSIGVSKGLTPPGFRDFVQDKVGFTSMTPLEKQKLCDEMYPPDKQFLGQLPLPTAFCLIAHFFPRKSYRDVF